MNYSGNKKYNDAAIQMDAPAFVIRQSFAYRLQMNYLLCIMTIFPETVQKKVQLLSFVPNRFLLGRYTCTHIQHYKKKIFSKEIF